MYYTNSTEEYYKMYYNDSKKLNYIHLKKGNKWRYTQNSRQAATWEQEGFVIIYKPGEDVAQLDATSNHIETMEEWTRHVDVQIDTETLKNKEAKASLKLKKRKAGG